MNLDLVAFLEKLSGASLPLIAVLVLYAGWKKYWVWGYQLEDLRMEKERELENERRDKNEWKSLVFQTKQLTDRSVSALSKVVDREIT